jgi:hypothetical protein
MAQGTGLGLALVSLGLGSGLRFSKRESGEAKPKPWFPGQARETLQPKGSKIYEIQKWLRHPCFINPHDIPSSRRKMTIRRPV